jgi:hypothetical protein
VPAPASVPGRARAGPHDPLESRPIIPGKGGACCATASSCSRTGAHCLPMAKRPRPPHRHGTRGWQSSPGRHEGDDGRWLMHGGRGRTGHLCVGCFRGKQPHFAAALEWAVGILVVPAGRRVRQPVPHRHDVTVCGIAERAAALIWAGSWDRNPARGKSTEFGFLLAAMRRPGCAGTMLAWRSVS